MNGAANQVDWNAFLLSPCEFDRSLIGEVRIVLLRLAFTLRAVDPSAVWRVPLRVGPLSSVRKPPGARLNGEKGNTRRTRRERVADDEPAEATELRGRAFSDQPTEVVVRETGTHRSNLTCRPGRWIRLFWRSSNLETICI